MFFCAGNWKMNKNPEQAAAYIKQLRAEAPAGAHADLVILPPALVSWQVSEGLRGTSIRWGGQNCYHESKGAFTGENSPQVLAELGAGFCLVGHSERRHIFGESDELLSKKVPALQNVGLTPILCVGETLDERRTGRTEAVIVRQLRAGVQHANPAKALWLAYEPVWAIGTGQVATAEQVEEAHLLLRKSLEEWNVSAASKIPILYGGSVKPDNVAALATLKNVNGFLIGGASLEVSDFLKIYRGAQQARSI